MEDVLFHPDIRPFLTNSEHSLIMLPEWEWLNWGYEPVKFKSLDDRTFSLFFEESYPGFVLQQVRSARWQMLLRPSHYLKQFHQRYAPQRELTARMKAAGFSSSDWGAYYHLVDPPIREAGYFLPSNIPRIWDYPTLDPFVFEPFGSREKFLLTRNPYYYAVDTEGRQLPYIDQVERVLVSDLTALKNSVLTGKVDFSGCFLKIADYKTYVAGSTQTGYSVRLLRPWQIQQAVILINFCPEQSELRPIVQDLRFRQALSYALDRDALCDELFMGFGVPSQATAGDDKPYYMEEFVHSYADFSPEKGRTLLNEMGLPVGLGGQRLLPDGAPLTMKLVYFPVTPMADEVAEVVSYSFNALGIGIETIRLDHGSQMGRYQEENRHIFSIWEMCGDDPLIPYQIGGLSDPVPLWWHWYETGGTYGVLPSENARYLYHLRDSLKREPDEAKRYEYAREIYRLQAENLWIIGTVAGVPQPFIHHKRLGNIARAEKEGWFLSTVLGGLRQWYFR
jgi:peptide/nickel transport system substrate-binding protein